MYYSLLLIGAHDGSKTEKLVQTASGLGPVILIEAVPWIYKKLDTLHKSRGQVYCINEAVSSKDGVVDFFMFSEDAKNIDSCADQMGSLNSSHATDHCAELKSFQKKIQCSSRTFDTLIKELNISSLDLLITDIEGTDVQTLLQFPFQLLRPRQILFEAKHSDGPMRIGKKLATFLLMLENLEYRVCMLSNENMIAVDERSDSTKPLLKIHI